MSLDQLRRDARNMMTASLEAAKPHNAVRDALAALPDDGKNLFVLAIGKAAWAMAEAASEVLGEQIREGIVITKYDHDQGELPNFEIFEAGHPVLDQNSLDATAKALELADRLGANDRLIFLISGGGSALFEHSDLSLEALQDINEQLLASGADIVKMNTIRKRLSNVKGGQFAERVQPAGIFAVVLSDVLGDRLDSIASGPAYPDTTTREEARKIIADFNLNLSKDAQKLIDKAMPQSLNNVTTHIAGSVAGLIAAADETARDLGYETHILTDRVDCEARELGRFLGALAQTQSERLTGRHAFILGGETVVTLTGEGKGGRNQEIALAAAPYLSDVEAALVFSLGSDGTDGPTDAAGGIVDSESMQKLSARDIDIAKVLRENDSYPALETIDGLIMTGPTGTNVNDLTVLLFAN